MTLGRGVRQGPKGVRFLTSEATLSDCGAADARVTVHQARPHPPKAVNRAHLKAVNEVLVIAIRQSAGYNALTWRMNGDSGFGSDRGGAADARVAMHQTRLPPAPW